MKEQYDIEAQLANSIPSDLIYMDQPIMISSNKYRLGEERRAKSVGEAI